MITLSWLASREEQDMAGGDVVDAYFEILVLDGTVNEGYDIEAMATEHPVEEGADITDHVKAALRRMTFEVVVSAHPGAGSAAVAGLSEGDAVSRRPATVRTTLDRLLREGIEIDIETNVGAWESMLLVNVSETRSNDHGDGFRATITAREFRTVATEEVEAPSPRVERGRRQADRGRHAGEGEDGDASSDSEERTSALRTLTRALGSALDRRGAQ